MSRGPISRPMVAVARSRCRDHHAYNGNGNEQIATRECTKYTTKRCSCRRHSAAARNDSVVHGRGNGSKGNRNEKTDSIVRSQDRSHVPRIT